MSTRVADPAGHHEGIEGGVRPAPAAAGRPAGAARIAAVARALRDDRGVRLSLALVLWLRVALQVTLLAGRASHGRAALQGRYLEEVDPRTATLWPLDGPWEWFDSLWFVHIARTGYTSGSSDVAFFPLYPGTIRVVATLLGGAYVLAALVVSTLALVGALALLHRLVRRDLGEAVATRTLLVLCCLPTAFYLAAPYSESLFLLLSVGGFALLRGGRFGGAAVVMSLAALTRVQGVLLCVPLAVEIGTALWRDRRAGGGPGTVALVRAAVLCALPAVATLGWYLAGRDALGTPGGFLGAQSREWGAAAAPPWQVVHNSLTVILRPGQNMEAFNLGCLAAGLVALLVMAVTRPLPSSWTAYTAAMLLPSLLRGAGGTPLQSTSRYLIVIFPLAVLIALVRAPRWVGIPVLLGSTAVMLFLADQQASFLFVA